MRPVVYSLRDDPGRVGMAVLWSVLLAAYIGFFYYYRGASEIADAEFDGYLEVMLLAVPLVVLFGGIVWLSESDIDPGLHNRVVGWTAGVSLLFLLVMSTAMFVIEAQYDRGETPLLLLIAVGSGASMGTVTGIIEAHSIHRGRARERAAVEARRYRHEQQRLEYLNQYLRHEVLNEVNKISGYTRLLEGHLDPDSEPGEWVQVIRDASDEVGTFIGSIRTIMDEQKEDLSVRPTDVSLVVEETASRVCRRSGTEVTVDAPERAYATAGDLLDRVFTNLIENALKHGDDPTVRVVVRSTDDAVVARVSDDGPGIPPAERGSLFDPPESGDHGYGLFLSRHLVELYGGRLELEGTGASGTTFVVRLEAAHPPERDDDASAERVTTRV